MPVRNQDIRGKDAQSSPISWAEYAKILDERPATLHESYVKAINAVAKVHAEGYITDSEASALLRLASGQFIAVTFDGVLRSLENWTPTIDGWDPDWSYSFHKGGWGTRRLNLW